MMVSNIRTRAASIVILIHSIIHVFLSLFITLCSVFCEEGLFIIASIAYVAVSVWTFVMSILCLRMNTDIKYGQKLHYTLMGCFGILFAFLVNLFLLIYYDYRERPSAMMLILMFIDIVAWLLCRSNNINKLRSSVIAHKQSVAKENHAGFDDSTSGEIYDEFEKIENEMKIAEEGDDSVMIYPQVDGITPTVIAPSDNRDSSEW